MNLFPYREKARKKFFYNYWCLWGISIFLSIGLMVIFGVQIDLDNFKNQKILDQENQNLIFLKKSLDQDQKILQQSKLKQASLSYLNNLLDSNKNLEIFFEMLPTVLPTNVSVNYLSFKESFKENIFKLNGTVESGQGITEESIQQLSTLRPLGVFQTEWVFDTQGNDFAMTLKD